GGEKIVIYPFRELFNADLPENIFLNIIYEDNDILIINKNAGLVVHPGAGNMNGTILNALLYRYKNIHNLPRSGIVHRLDKNTSGLMVIAKNMYS
ncbi:MAG: pseudouridine synthase, partial [Serratia symbiotica]|nr:pseudouridine synthase [Serratia symbiotica]